MWTLSELVAEVAARISALPEPRNGQVRAVPDDRTIRYYAAIGLLDRPSMMRGRTALYGRKHVAQVVAIKRLQAMGRSLSEIQTMWPTLDDRNLARMSGVELEPRAPHQGRAKFWKREPEPSANARREAIPLATRAAEPVGAGYGTAAAAVDAGRAREAIELRVELAPRVVLSLSLVGEGVAISPADVRALRVAAAPLLAELAFRRLASLPEGDEP